jgi:hypothetical protein
VDFAATTEPLVIAGQRFLGAEPAQTVIERDTTSTALFETSCSRSKVHLHKVGCLKWLRICNRIGIPLDDEFKISIELHVFKYLPHGKSPLQIEEAISALVNLVAEIAGVLA